ncbi:hypothetical protein AVEN_159316-1 [Araneus ventricosus]|uniref:Uncharacterized protein n=1 Tax=Araneus ventricosus TaxID=182803 RepID=A0A4Y2A0F6_ARAVE|nr:hypothetical protein AVEN_159316-1 [Araneus ventricosus]
MFYSTNPSRRIFIEDILEMGNHKKPSPRPALASGSTLNDQPPRLHRSLWARLIAPITNGLCDDNPFYRILALRNTPSLLYPPGKRESAYLSGSF